jgi:hypothetical protein
LLPITFIWLFDAGTGAKITTDVGALASVSASSTILSTCEVFDKREGVGGRAGSGMSMPSEKEMLTTQFVIQAYLYQALVQVFVSRKE